MNDYSKYAQPAESLEGMAKLTELTATLQETEMALAMMEAEVKRVTQVILDLKEQQIPELMEDLGVAEYTTSEGVKVSLKKNVFASLGASNSPKAMAAYKWLDDNGHGTLIKRNVVVSFPREQAEEAALLADSLREQHFATKIESKVEPSTLRSFVAQALDKGEDIPLDTFSVFVKKTAIIQGPKHE